jgi:hypothetical protein
MTGELKSARFDPMTADAAAWGRFHELRRRHEKERRPDDPIQPDEEVEVRMKKENPFDKQHFYEMTRDGEIVSSFSGESTSSGRTSMCGLRTGGRALQAGGCR